jgi:putative hemolysin
MEIIIILLLTILNGFFALSETALVSSKRTKLESQAKRGSKGAAAALKLLEDPEQFLSAVQVGITLIGVISGAFGGVAIAALLQPVIEGMGVPVEYSSEIAFTIVVSLITYFSIVLGELVPKTIALNNPESIATFVAPIIRVFTMVTFPIVKLLTFSTRVLLKIMFIKDNPEQPISEEELRMMIKLANKQGTLKNKETEMLQNMLRFEDRKSALLMTPRADVIWIDSNESIENIKKLIQEYGFSKFPLYDAEEDTIIGIFHIKDFYQQHQQPDFNIRDISFKPLYIPRTTTAIKVLDTFVKQKNYFGVVVDEYGHFEGIVTKHDLAENIFGDMPDMNDDDEPEIVQREDGSYLIEGSAAYDDVVELLALENQLRKGMHETISGLVLEHMGKIPHAGEHVQIFQYRFEIVDMDGLRIDKILVALHKK